MQNLRGEQQRHPDRALWSPSLHTLSHSLAGEFSSLGFFLSLVKLFQDSEGGGGGCPFCRWRLDTVSVLQCWSEFSKRQWHLNLYTFHPKQLVAERRSRGRSRSLLIRSTRASTLLWASSIVSRTEAQVKIWDFNKKMQSDLKMDQTYQTFLLSCKLILSSKVCGSEQHPGETSSLWGGSEKFHTSLQSFVTKFKRPCFIGFPLSILERKFSHQQIVSFVEVWIKYYAFQGTSWIAQIWTGKMISR